MVFVLGEVLGILADSQDLPKGDSPYLVGDDTK